jgi:hypothetical protein
VSHCITCPWESGGGYCNAPHRMTHESHSSPQGQCRGTPHLPCSEHICSTADKVSNERWQIVHVHCWQLPNQHGAHTSRQLWLQLHVVQTVQRGSHEPEILLQKALQLIQYSLWHSSSKMNVDAATGGKPCAHAHRCAQKSNTDMCTVRSVPHDVMAEPPLAIIPAAAAAW